MQLKLREFTLAGLFVSSAATVWGQAVAPYTADANTVHLFHFDEASGGEAANAVAGKNKAYTWTLSSATGAANTSLLGATGHTGFGKCVDLGSTAINLGVAYDGNGNSTYNGETTDAIAMSTLGIGGTNPFTLEAVISPNTLTALNREIISTDASVTTRGFQFRITAGGSLEFNMIGVPGSQKLVALPTTGEHVMASGSWYHVAFVYDGTNCRFFWTKLGSSAVTAVQLGADQALSLTGAGTITGPLIFGNENRAAGGEGAQSKIDEVRISNIARAANAFVFSNNNPDDTDSDGLSDTWEITNFGSITAQNGGGDPDGDLATNEQEETAGTNPNSSTSFPDADSDGLSDAWETTYFGGTSAQAGGGDPDGDGFTNTQEFAGKSDPTNNWLVPDDVDGDGLSDAWENTNLGSLSQNAYDDGDNDGYGNLAELLGGTSPVAAGSHPAWQSPGATLLQDSTVTTNARLFASNATYGRVINGVSFQDQILTTFDGYQYTAWYDQTALTVFLARRTVSGSTTGAWEVVNTGSAFTNGVGGDAHNVIAFGICATDGTLHMAWDHHGHTLRYRKSVAGLCTTNKAAWGAGMMNAEQNWLVASGQTISTVTYPLFVSAPGGGLAFQWRFGSSGSGDNMLSLYNGTSHTWSTPVQFDTRNGTYTEGAFTGTSRNAYLNGFDFSPDGKMHISWTYREGAGTSNHDICYAYSADQGVTWRNNAGTVIADTSLGQRISLTSPGILTKRKNLNQLLINQQAQCVDADGRMHMLMLHRREDPGYEYPNITTAVYSINGTAYYHYFRDPLTGRWSQRRIPPNIAPVGCRPSIGYDAEGNLYAAYLTYTDRSEIFPGYRGGYLVIATASKESSYTDWEVVYTSTTKFNGEPLLDQSRLEQDHILSVFIQEDSTVTSAVGSSLHVMDFVVAPADSDNDGLQDSWEIACFGNLNQTPSGDPDGDGFNNADEATAGSNPTLAASTPLDIDGDGLGDAWETANFGGISAQDGTGDPDFDFATNAREYNGGNNSSNPNSAASWPDTDADTLNDGWEIANFANLSKTNTDTDGDGASNAAEMAAGSDPNDPASTPTKARLAHRWSFNGSLVDSAGNSDAIIVNVGANNATLGANNVTMAGGAKASSDYVKLGSNLLNGTMKPVTIELWATQNQVQNWGRIFDFNLDTTEYLFMSWTVATGINTDRSAWKQAPGNESAPSNNSNAPYTLGTPFHIVMTITPAVNTNGAVTSGSRVTVYSAPANSSSLGAASSTFTTTYHLANLNDVVDALGWSPWADNTASATYDEVRIWDGALTTAALELNQTSGPDLITDPDDTDADGLRDSWETAMFGSLTAENATGDADHDGTSNLTEQRLGLNPNDGNSRFAAALSPTGITWPGAEGVSFVVQRSTNFSSWTDLATQPGANGTNTYNDPAPPTGRAFYRVGLAP